MKPQTKSAQSLMARTSVASAAVPAGFDPVDATRIPNQSPIITQLERLTSGLGELERLLGLAEERLAFAMGSAKPAPASDRKEPNPFPGTAPITNMLAELCERNELQCRRLGHLIERLELPH